MKYAVVANTHLQTRPRASNTPLFVRLGLPGPQTFVVVSLAVASPERPANLSGFPKNYLNGQDGGKACVIECERLWKLHVPLR